MLAAVQKCVLGEPPVNGIKLEPRSTMLMLENALATEKLSPSRQWVPWLTINDEPVCKTDKDFAQMFLVGKKFVTHGLKRLAKRRLTSALASSSKFQLRGTSTTLSRVPRSQRRRYRPTIASWRRRLHPRPIKRNLLLRHRRQQRV